jgi:4-amino-4-deoxy-L-arabinose transferase-like glycosyltransferase
LPIIALGATLRFYRLGHHGLWLDEAFSVWMARLPVVEMLHWLVRIDQHPPLYYLLVRMWMGLGDGEAVVRALSALCSTLTIPVIYLLGRRVIDEKAGLLAALILAASPFHVRLAQEARMYALLAFSAIAALVALAHLLTDPRAATVKIGQQFADAWRAWRATRGCPRLRDIKIDLTWLAYILFTTATLLTHNTAIFLPIAANLLILGLLPQFPVPSLRSQDAHSKRNIFLRSWFLAQAGVLLLWLPWLPSFVAQSTSVYQDFWIPIPTWRTVVNTIGVFASDMLPPTPIAIGGAGVLFAGLAIAGILHLRRCPARLLFVLVVLLTPIAGEWLISLRRPIFYDRTLIWASIPFYLLLAAGIARLRRRSLVIGGLMLVLALNGLSLHEYYANFQKEQWDHAAALVAEQAEPNDLVLFNTAFGQIPFDYYLGQLNHNPVAEHGVPVDLFDRRTLEPKMVRSDLPRLRTLVANRQRVWLIYSHHWYTDPQELVPEALDQALVLQHEWEYDGVQVLLYEREAGGE